MAFNRTASLPSGVQRLESKTTVSHRLVICQCLHWQKPLNAGYLCLIDVGLFRKSEAQRMRSIRSKKNSNMVCSGQVGWVYEFNGRIIWTWRINKQPLFQLMNLLTAASPYLLG